MKRTPEQEAQEQKKYYIVEADALPEVFIKVAHAKELIKTGKAATVAAAAAVTGISRSAYYKYQGAIRPFQDLERGRIVTFQMLLCDRTGILSSVLSVFAGSGANILTIYQGIPANGTASVTISAGTEDMACEMEDLLTRIRMLEGVVKIDITAA
ncbi:MAG: ACT domain-containing protein [Eubacteriales bacterium]|nr:ACT domain-containing protein [Eubacteriales bacterium]